MKNIIAEIKTLSKWKRAAFASMCTSSLSPVVVRFATPATRVAFENGLAIAWNSCLSESVDVRIAVARTILDNLEESACDDSCKPAYEVMRAIGALACTLESITDENRFPAIESCDIVLGSWSGIDYVLEYDKQSRVIDPHCQPLCGPLESLLASVQYRAIEVLRSAEQVDRKEVLALAAFGNQLAIVLDLTLPSYAARRGWE